VKEDQLFGITACYGRQHHVFLAFQDRNLTDRSVIRIVDSDPNGAIFVLLDVLYMKASKRPSAQSTSLHKAMDAFPFWIFSLSFYQAALYFPLLLK